MGEGVFLEESGLLSSKVSGLGVMKEKSLRVAWYGRAGREGLTPGLPFLGLGAVPS